MACGATRNTTYLDKRESDLLINGYIKSLKTSSTIIPNEIIVLCSSFYDQFVDVKLVYCRNKTGIINTQKYTSRSFPFIYTLKHVAIDLENEMEWDNKKKFTPYIHIWLKFGQIKSIYPMNKPTIRMEELQYEDDNRWVEVPDDYLIQCKINDIIPNKDNDIIVIEKKQDDDTWPRAKDENWRNILQTGDIIDVKDPMDKWYESWIRYIYPNNSDKAGKCIIHYIGWHVKWDEIIDIDDEDRVANRGTHTLGAHSETCTSFDVMNKEKGQNQVFEVYRAIFHENGICIFGHSRCKMAVYKDMKDIMITYEVICLMPGDKDAIGIMSNVDECRKTVWMNEMNGYKYWLQADGIFAQKNTNDMDKVIVNRKWRTNDVVLIEVDQFLGYVAFYINNELMGNTVFSLEPNLNYYLFIGTRTNNVQYEARKSSTKQNNYYNFEYYRNNL